MTPAAREGKTTHPVQFRKLLQRLGPIFVKAGQYLALRPDLIPQEYCDELMNLLDRMPPFPWEQARQTFVQELGVEPAEAFAFINLRPIAAGSLAQVHLARLRDGAEVAVKIQRPGIRERVLRDLKRARLISRILDMSTIRFLASPREVAEELAAWMLQEIDFSRELRNMQRLYRLSASSLIQRVPRPFPHLSSERIVTSQYLRGIPVSEVLRSLDSDRAGGPRRAELRGIDLDGFAENLVTATLTQILRYQFFHADLHPGNLQIISRNLVGYVDFGLCDQLDDRIRQSQTIIISAIYSGEVNRIFEALTEMLIPDEATDMEEFKRDFIKETQAFQGSRQPQESENAQGDDVRRSPFAVYLVGLLRAARRNKLQVPTRVLSMYRALLAVETVAGRLGTGSTLRRVGRQFFRDLQRDEFIEELSRSETLDRVLLSLVNFTRDTPQQLNQILTDLAAGTLGVRAQVSESRGETQARNRRARLVTMAILSVGIAVLLTIPRLPVLFGFSIAWPLAAGLTLLYVSVLIAWWRL